MTSTTVDAAPRRGSRALAVLQRIGRSLMLPIAVLPAAALLLRFGQPDMLGQDGLGWIRVAEVVGGAGQALFDNLPLLFAVGVAIGFAKKSDGSTALAAVVGYLVFDHVTKIMFSHSDDLKGSVVQMVHQDDGSLKETIEFGLKNPTDVLGGILIGVVAALLYQRFHRVKLPTYLAFFGGRRFVPIVTALAALVLGVLIGFIWPVFGGWLTDFGDWITGAGAAGAGIYGVVNRLLLPFGLHHIPNSLIWFVFGSYNGPDGVVHGEINRYLAGDPHSGGFLAGFFPVLMFGLPGAALAIWRAAPPHRRSAVGGIMISAALTAFVTGVTEPIEFAFMFVAPVLYAVHVVLTGISMAILNAAGAQLGFGFSAGGIDMLLNASKDNTKGLPLIIGMGILYFVIYYFLFKFLIVKFDFATPGREPEDVESVAADPGSNPELAGGEKKSRRRKPAAEPADSPTTT
ncbi:PTS transporter subunit EIIC [Actinomadura sp. NTSP31]|uniref:PTS transporter subunit EIIC n=1 Tax=Actinomadura sp. NTSP31 TaxID=1735447 RepID=UPI0035BF9F6D